MPTKIGVWNEAIAILGRQPLTSTTATDDASRQLADLWTRVPTAVLEEADWNSCIERVRLARLDATPAHGYDYYYQMPTNWLRIVQVNDSGEEDSPFENWKQEAERIATNAEAIYLWFVASTSIDNPADWSQALADYVSGVMAHRAAPRLAPGMVDYAGSEMKRRRKLAMALDAKNNRPRRHVPGRWVRARLGGIRNATEQGR
jgi:hypothetical protein